MSRHKPFGKDVIGKFIADLRDSYNCDPGKLRDFCYPAAVLFSFDFDLHTISLWNIQSYGEWVYNPNFRDKRV